MNDNDIIKALECCKGEDIPCADCPYIDFGQCQTYVATDALRLINRQKAEIDRLTGFNENLQTANTALSNEILDIKAEAIKEFAEELKPRLRRNTHVSPFACNLNDVIIDNLVKEMTEEQE